MKTDDLIELIAKDEVPATGSPSTAIAAWLCGGTAISLVIYLAAIGWRPDIAEAMETTRFLLKFAIAISLSAGGLAWLLRKSRPAVPVGSLPWLMAAAGLILAVAVTGELAVVPSSDWLPRLVGDNWLYCLSFILLLSAGPLAGLLFALRSGAPDNPGLAGAVAGITSGGLAAVLYASHCTDDSPLFVATWYTLAIGIVTLCGAVIGRRVLAW
jgi:hypothetical protein